MNVRALIIERCWHAKSNDPSNGMNVPCCTVCKEVDVKLDIEHASVGLAHTHPINLMTHMVFQLTLLMRIGTVCSVHTLVSDY